MDILVLSELCLTLNTGILDLDLEASFIENGGHSLNAAALISACEARGCHITSKSIFSSDSIRELVTSAQSTINEQSELATESTTEVFVAASLKDHSDSPPESETQGSFDQVLPSTRSSIASLSDDTQSSRVSHSPSTPSFPSSPEVGSEQTSTSSMSTLDNQHRPEVLTDMQLSLVHGSLKTPGMNIITYSETYHSKDIPLMKMAWQIVVDMEPIFSSTAFDQFRRNECKRFLWHEESPAQNEEEISKAVERLRNESQIGSVFHVFPHKSSHELESLSTITWVVHHAFVDGYSASLLFDKMRKITAGMTVKPSLPFSQLFFALQELRRSRSKEGDAYWAKRLELSKSASGQLSLPIVAEDLTHTPFDEVVVDITSLRVGLVSAAKEMKVTLATLFNAAWALVLAKYADSNTITFGVVLSGRNLPLAGVRDIIGPLINTLPLSMKIDPESSTSSFVGSVMKTLTELGEFQWTTPKNGFSNDFESALAVQFGFLEPPKSSILPVGKGHVQQATEIPLSVMVEHDSKVRFGFHCQRYSKADIKRVGACYYQALQLLLHGDISIFGLLKGLVPLSSREMLSRYGNCLSDRTTRASITQDLVTLFEQIVKKFPDNLAIERENKSLTYASLDYAASRLAERLSKTVRLGDVVCVHADRSVNWIVAIYGILKAGGTYCPLDSGLSSELRNTMFINAGARTFILPHGTQRSFCPASSEHSIALDEFLKEIESTNKCVVSHREEPNPWSNAYLCFTSGSTGTPKGVVCTHEGLVAFQSDLRVRLYAQPGIKVSQVLSPAFDGSIHEIFSALSYGATLVLPMPDDPFGHLTSVDSVLLTPSIARVLDPEKYQRLSNVYLVGEQVPQSVNDKWSKNKNLYNMYGPTEATCGATIKRLMPDARVTIGGPNPTTRLYILDSRSDMAIPGVIGEIHIAGVQVAKGYLNLPDETQNRFLPDHISCNGEMMYKTGDKGYWNASGEVVCLGRNDRQIKLRGYRLDMNDLEIRVAREFPELEAIAIAPQRDHLVAMIQPASIDVTKLLARISMVLPSYAIPRHVMATDSLPTTRAGKIDYKAMSEMVHTTSIQELRGLSTWIERTVAAAFKKVLELDKRVKFTAQSNFVELGGHSLQQLSLSLHLSREIGAQIPLQLIIEHPAIEDLANAIDSFISHERSPVIRLQPVDEQSVSLIEDDWLKRYKFDAGSSCFNVSFTSTLSSGVVDRTKLADAWNTVLARHLLLRCRYITRRGKPSRRVYLDHAPRVERVKSLDLWAEINRPFQLDRTSPVRVYITEDRLIVVLSHIVADYTTLAILLKEASTLYNEQELLPVRSSYLDTFRSKEATKPCHLEFWSQYLHGCVDSPVLFGRNSERDGYRGTSVVSELSTTTAAKILAFAHSTSFTLQQLATASVALCVQPQTSGTDIVIGTPYINRHSEDAYETVGLFLEPLPVRVKFDPSEQEQSQVSITFLDSVRASSQAALAHVVPWHQLLDRLAVKNRYPNHPLSDVMVSFHDSRRMQSLGMAAPGFEPCFLWSEGSKFKLMCEFTALTSGKILLRLEYDPSCLEPDEVEMLQRCIPETLGLLAEGLGYQDVKARLAESKDMRHTNGKVVKDYFGLGLNEI
ncbi:MAG: hypothetical protein ASARMPREDX12_004428 [Alectoria sarmentosa]|nr:MAG: hypothetical protein ASARMPREDX12_004428 [Alectoria sarmentosa]